MNTAEEPYVITLVHGTFAPDALWVQPGSLLWQRLMSDLEGSSIIRSFRWTGENSVFSRQRAGDELRSHLRL